MNYIIGATGLIGSEIVKQFAIPENNIIPRYVYQDWWNPSLRKSIFDFIVKSIPPEGNLFIAAGLVDPSLKSLDLLRANFEMPKNVISVASELKIKTHTFGTIQEHFKTDNPYLFSKRALSDYLQENSYRNFHYRLHTLYGGGHQKDFMFLTKLSQSIISKEAFPISSGRQLREFHHVEDDISILQRISEKDRGGFFDINHGFGMTIGSFAYEVLLNYGLEGLLITGIYADPLNENYTQHFPGIRIEDSFGFRKPVFGFIEYQNSIMNS